MPDRYGLVWVNIGGEFGKRNGLRIVRFQLGQILTGGARAQDPGAGSVVEGSLPRSRLEGKGWKPADFRHRDH